MRSPFRPALAVVSIIACAAFLSAADSWTSKDPEQWTSEEIDQILTKSAWAKHANVSFERSGTGGRGGYPGGRSGGGYPGGGGGIGFPGGGIGFPGGGGVGRGGGMGRGRGGDGGSQTERESVLVRWDSGLPVKQALQRSEPHKSSSDTAPTASASSTDNYIVTVIGLRTPRNRNRDDNDGDDSSGQDSSRTHPSRDPDQIKEQLMSSTLLTPKGGDPIAPTDVQMDPAVGTSQIHFVFPRTKEISPDDKEVDFSTRMGPAKVSAKFHPKEMKYKGKLEL